ncbi:chitinase [Amylostereum chailletii]|nr:chitinase [Amylostereum chailletii]
MLPSTLGALLASASLANAHASRFPHAPHKARGSNAVSTSVVVSATHAATALATPKSFPDKTDLVAATWYAGWHSDDFPLSSVSWDKYTHITYAFAETAPSVTELSLNGSNPALLPEFVSTAKKNGVKALISIGGWTGGLYFSTNVGSAENRTAFVKTVTDFVTNYSLDGVDFDWEYPNAAGIGCNNLNANDTANFLSFLQELRAHPVGSNLIVTAAASLNTWYDANQSPSADLSGFADVLNYIAVMNYDVWGSWSDTAGPNGPLNDTCATDPARQVGSGVTAIAAWNKAGIPLNQLVLGVPAYGHSFRVSLGANETLDAYPAFNKTNKPVGDRWDETELPPDVCGNPQSAGGTFTYWGLIEGGFIKEDGTVVDGIQSGFDDCSQTPYVYNATSDVFVSYDNARSFKAKGEFIDSTGLRGFATWEAGGDYKDTLLDSIRDAAGFC